MKVLHIDSSDTQGGAARAAFRIHRALLKAGVASRFAALESHSGDWRVWQPGKWTRLGRKGCAFLERRAVTQVGRVKDDVPWSLAWSGHAAMVDDINASDADVVQLHWVNGGTLSVGDVARIQKPIVWTLHDMWPFTGGCHYAGDCGRYASRCETCPELARHLVDFARRQFDAKMRKWKTARLSVVTPSQWLAACAGKSALFRKCPVTTIPNPLDLSVYKPVDRRWAREVLNIPQERQVILFGADTGTADPRKGYDLLCASLRALAERIAHPEQILLLVFGASAPQEPEGFPFDVQYAGRLQDDAALVLLYRASDVFAAPSREDNLPNTIAEAMACGTPCVGFDIGGVPDMIRDGVTGRVIAPFDTEAFAQGLADCLVNHAAWSAAARRAAERMFDEARCAAAYREVYEALVSAV